MEKDTDSSFVRATGEKGNVDKTTTYYYCNRSGYFTSSGKQKRHLKSQGSCKVNSYCTASIIVRTTPEKGIKVQYYPTHYGHATSLGHLRLSEKERVTIAGKFLQGVTFERILDDIRCNVDTSLRRIHLTTRKDITNIQQAYGLRDFQHHADDATSVMLWVEATRKHIPSPVLLYKQQGKLPGIECKYLLENDFMLVLQTPLQAEVLKKCAPNRIICIDDTHGTNSYDFYLTTVLAVDEFGEGYPTAWCLCNRTDFGAIVDFLRAVQKNIVLGIKPKWVMIDDAEQFYTAWVTVFGQGPQKLLCSWHVDGTWRKAVKIKIEDRGLAALRPIHTGHLT